jgi:hypothetical protein
MGLERPHPFERNKVGVTVPSWDHETVAGESGRGKTAGLEEFVAVDSGQPNPRKEVSAIMRRLAGFFVATAAVVTLCIGIAALTPDSHAVNPKETRCWSECWVTLHECCRYVAPGVGSWVKCVDTGWPCAPI